MMIKSINTFITTSTMFTELADLQNNMTAWDDLEDKVSLPLFSMQIPNITTLTTPRMRQGFNQLKMLKTEINITRNLIPQHCTKCRREHPLQIVPVAAKDLHLCGNLLLQNSNKRNLLILNTNLNLAYPTFLHYWKTHSLIKIQHKLKLEAPENKVRRKCWYIWLMLANTIRWVKGSFSFYLGTWANDLLSDSLK